MNGTHVMSASFCDIPLYIVEEKGEPYIPARAIVQGMGLDWGAQRRKLIAHALRWGCIDKTIYLSSGTQKTLCLPLRRLNDYLAGIRTAHVHPEKQDILRRCQAECADALWRHWAQTHPDRSAARLREIERLGVELRALAPHLHTACTLAVNVRNVLAPLPLELLDKADGRPQGQNFCVDSIIRALNREVYEAETGLRDAVDRLEDLMVYGRAMLRVLQQQ